MPPTTVHLVRHAQGFHNISVANHAIHDPLLTPTGEDQCKSLQKNFPAMSEIDCVVASPLKRTMYTALLSFAPTIESKKLRVIALPELQETSDLPCDTGSDPKEIEREFSGKPIDMSIMYTPQAKSWNSKTGKWAPNSSAIDDRARIAREWLYARLEKEIVVVTHGGFLHYFTQDWRDTHKMDGTPSAGKSFRLSRRRSDNSSSSISIPTTSHPQPDEQKDPKLHPRHHQHQHHHRHYTSPDPQSPSDPKHKHHDANHIHKHEHQYELEHYRGKHLHKDNHEHHKSNHHHGHTHMHKHHDGTYSYLVSGTGWANTEFRSYTFDNSNGRISLVETPESLKKRVGDNKPLSKEEQKNLQRARQQQWAEQEKQEKAYQKASGIQEKLRQRREERELGGYGYGF